MSLRHTARRIAAALAFLACPVAFAAPQVVPTQLPAQYGDKVQVELRNWWAPYAPATRYTRNGSSIVVEYEYLSGGFNEGPAFAPRALNLGELPPGNYTVTARLIDINQPNATRGTVRWFDANGNSFPDKQEIRLYDSGDGFEVECASCHDPHGVPSGGQGTTFNPTFLRKANTGSAVCLTCHTK